MLKYQVGEEKFARCLGEGGAVNLKTSAMPMKRLTEELTLLGLGRRWPAPLASILTESCSVNLIRIAGR